MADWQKMPTPDTPLLEIVVRGSIMYLTPFFLLRVLLKRESGTTGVTDLLVIELIADAAQKSLRAWRDVRPHHDHVPTLALGVSDLANVSA